MSMQPPHDPEEPRELTGTKPVNSTARDERKWSYEAANRYPDAYFRRP
jgi:hypothetical protein